MAKIAFIGAGSFGFTRTLVKDILTFPRLKDAEIHLMDIDGEKLEFITRAVNKIVEKGNYPAKVVSTKNRKKAVEGADAVLCTILSGGVNAWRRDLEIPLKYGIDMAKGDTRGASGIFRALRTVPVMLDICKDIMKHSPKALLLNYTNPMGMLCRAMQRETDVNATGLCHSVQGTARRLARWIGADFNRTRYVCAGINHQAWYVKFEKDGKDAYPLLRKAMKKKDIYNEDIVRNEMFLHLDYYVSESSAHNSEYNWWFRKKPELIKKYTPEDTCKNRINHFLKREKTWKREIKKWMAEDISLERGNEYASNIINAVLGGEAFRFNGNVPNRGIITNLPEEACVEVPVYADVNGINAVHVGELPPQCAALNGINIAVEEMAVDGAVTGNARKVFQAICNDPLTASVLPLSEIKKMVQEMFNAHKNRLPQFKSFQI